MRTSGIPLSSLPAKMQEQVVAQLHPLAGPQRPIGSSRLYPLAIWLPGYRVPSLNRILGKKWQAVTEKKIARNALWRFLIVNGTQTTPPENKMHVLVTLYRCQLIDIDNAFVKPLIDQLRYTKLLMDDNPDAMALTIQQVKVGKRTDEGTKLVLTEALV